MRLLARALAIAVCACWACADGRTHGADAAAPPAPEDALPLVHDGSMRVASTHEDGTLRLVSWNIKAARQAPLDAIGRRLLQLQPDVVALQEVDRGASRTGGTDQAAALAGMLQVEYAFAAALPYDVGHHGLAVLSRHPLGSVERIALSNQDAEEPRTALDVAFCAGGACVRLVDHHADLPRAAGERSALEVLEAVRGDLGRGVLVAGDFNQTPAEPGVRSYVDAGLHDLLAATESDPEASDRVDFIFADGALAACSRHVELVALQESDHPALIADFELGDCAR